MAQFTRTYPAHLHARNLGVNTNNARLAARQTVFFLDLPTADLGNTSDGCSVRINRPEDVCTPTSEFARTRTQLNRSTGKSRLRTEFAPEVWTALSTDLVKAALLKLVRDGRLPAGYSPVMRKIGVGLKGLRQAILTRPKQASPQDYKWHYRLPCDGCDVVVVSIGLTFEDHETQRNRLLVRIDNWCEHTHHHGQLRGLQRSSLVAAATSAAAKHPCQVRADTRSGLPPEVRFSGNQAFAGHNSHVAAQAISEHRRKTEHLDKDVKRSTEMLAQQWSDKDKSSQSESDQRKSVCFGYVQELQFYPTLRVALWTDVSVKTYLHCLRTGCSEGWYTDTTGKLVAQFEGKNVYNTLWLMTHPVTLSIFLLSSDERPPPLCILEVVHTDTSESTVIAILVSFLLAAEAAAPDLMALPRGVRPRFVMTDFCKAHINAHLFVLNGGIRLSTYCSMLATWIEQLAATDLDKLRSKLEHLTLIRLCLYHWRHAAIELALYGAHFKQLPLKRRRFWAFMLSAIIGGAARNNAFRGGVD